MIEWIGPTAIIGLLTVGGLYLGHLFTRKSNKDTLLLSSRDEHIDDLREDLRDTRERLATIETTVQGQADRIKDLEVREWSLRRYVYALIDKIKSMGGEPPDPPNDLRL